MKTLGVMSDAKYFNFPVTFLQGAFINIRGVMEDIMNYAVYTHTMKLEKGTTEAKMKNAAKYFNMTLGNESRASIEGKKLFNETPTKTPMTGINVTIAFDFYENYKTQDDISVLLAYLAIKSILGNKPYVCITNDFLLARMGGYTSVSNLPTHMPDPLAGYATRRKLDRIKQELKLSWKVNIYGYRTKGYYVSIDSVCNYEKLVLEAEKNRKNAKDNKFRKKQDEARKKAHAELYCQN